MRFRQSRGYMSLQATRVLEGHITRCFLCSHPPSLRCWLLTSVRDRPLSKPGFALSQQSQFYVSKQPQRVQAAVIQSCFSSGRQVWRNHWASIGKVLYHVTAESPRCDRNQTVSTQGHLPEVI